MKHFDGVNRRWFLGATTNITSNALDRRVEGGKKNKLAYLWLGEDGSERAPTYGMLLSLVNRLANGLKSLGVARGDRVVVYMPLTVEGVAAMLACARVGAIHSVVYAGFAAGAHQGRGREGRHHRRRGLPARQSRRPQGHRRCGGEGLGRARAPRRLPAPAPQAPSREKEVDFETLLEHPAECEADLVDSEHPLYILYTSGTTGAPKGSFTSTAATWSAPPTTCGTSST